MSTTITCVVTVHNDNPENILNQLVSQTRPPDEVIVVYSSMNIEPRPGIKYIEDENRGDYGHNKRRIGLREAQSASVGFFNSDDVYNLDYIEKLLEGLKTADFSYCNFTSHIYGGAVVDSRLEHGKITSGNFLVRTDIAKQVGYNHDVYHADWLFIKDLLDVGVKTTKIDEVLYNHL